MSQFRNVEPLESYRLGRCQLPMSCQFCGHDNVLDADRCRNCCAPMSLSRSILGKKQRSGPRPKLFATLGREESGKTVFLGMLLDILSRQREQQLDYSSCDSASVAIQQETVAALARGEFPDMTPDDPDKWRWAHCLISRRMKTAPHEIFMSDVSGASLFRELERPGTCDLLKGLFLRSSGFLLCLDAGKVNAGEKDEEFFTMRLINHLRDCREREDKGTPTKGRRKQSRKQFNPPIALVLTKSDECESAFDGPSEFIKGFTPNLWELCQSLPNEVSYFAVSAVGRCAVRRFAHGRRIHVPLRVEPRGIIGPFRWLLGRNYPS